jgi:hypothetical protein
MGDILFAIFLFALFGNIILYLISLIFEGLSKNGLNILLILLFPITIPLFCLKEVLRIYKELFLLPFITIKKIAKFLYLKYAK